MNGAILQAKKLRMAILTFFIGCFMVWQAFTQSTYILTSGNDLYRLESDFQLSFVVSIDDSGGETMFTDIAISPFRVFYGIAKNEIYEINIQNGKTVLVASLPNFISGNSLACSDDFELYTIDTYKKRLVRYDILTNEYEVVGYLGLSTPGDLTFYKGDLLFPAFDEDNDVYNLLAYDLKSHGFTKILSLDQQRLLGMANIFSTCESNTIIGASGDGTLFQLDIDNQLMIEQVTEHSLHGIHGSASDNEHMASKCLD